MKNGVTGGGNSFSGVPMIIRVKVKPGCKKFAIDKKGGFLVIHTKAEAEYGRANAEILNELSKIYKKVRIARGLKTPNKLIDVS